MARDDLQWKGRKGMCDRGDLLLLGFNELAKKKHIFIPYKGGDSSYMTPSPRTDGRFSHSLVRYVAKFR